MKRNFLTLFLVFGVFSSLPAQSNPFLTGGKAQNPSVETSTDTTFTFQETSAEVPGLIQQIAKIQKDLNAGLTAFLKSAAKGAPGALAALLLTALLYGFFHGLLPGHQKLTVTAYFVSQKASYLQALMAAGLFALFHAFFSLILILFFRMVLEAGAGASVDQANLWGQRFSALGLLGLGSVLLIFKVREWKDIRRRKALAEVQKIMGLPPGKVFDDILPPLSWGKFLWFLALAALLPCPGSLMILLFALGLGQLTLGVLAVCAVALGMGLLLWMIGTLVLFFKNRGQTWLGIGGRPGIYWGLELTSILVLMSFSLLFIN